MGSQDVLVNAESSVSLNEVGATTNKASNIIKNSIFNLSDQQMKNAIKLGFSGDETYNKFYNSQFMDILYDKMKAWQPEVSIITPYSLIASDAYFASDDYKEYTLADAKKITKMFAKIDVLKFSVDAFGDHIDFAKSIHIVLKQGSKIYQPLEVDGLDKLADTTSSWPDSPAYRNHLIADFDINKIDFSKPAELIYLFAGKDLSVTYKVDFSKIK